MSQHHVVTDVLPQRSWTDLSDWISGLCAAQTRGHRISVNISHVGDSVAEIYSSEAYPGFPVSHFALFVFLFESCSQFAAINVAFSW